MSKIHNKLALILLLISILMFFCTTVVSAKNVCIETKYIIENPDEKWPVESAKLKMILPSEDPANYSKDYSENLCTIENVWFNDYPSSYKTDEKKNQYATYYFPSIAGGDTKSFTVVSELEVYDDSDLKPAYFLAKKINLNGDISDIVSDSLGDDDKSDIEDINDLDISEESKKHLEPTISNSEIDGIARDILAESAVNNEGETVDPNDAYQVVNHIYELAMDRGNDNCEEYALYMAELLKKSYIPARTVSGFKIHKNDIDSDIDSNIMAERRHMWVEYLVDVTGTNGDGERWLIADPTPIEGEYNKNGTYFVDVNNYYLHDQYDITDSNSVNLKYRSYKSLTEGEDFYYEYSLNDNNTLIEPILKPEPDIIENNVIIEDDEVGFLTLDYNKQVFDSIKSMVWRSSDSSKLKIDNGFITPLIDVQKNKTETVEIYAIINGLSTKKITVEIRDSRSDYDEDDDEDDEKKLQKVISKLEGITIEIGSTFQLPTLKSAGIAGNDGVKILWQVDENDTGIVSVTGNTLRGLEEGHARITAKISEGNEEEIKNVDVYVLPKPEVVRVVINRLESHSVDKNKFLVGEPVKVQVKVYAETYIPDDDGGGFIKTKEKEYANEPADLSVVNSEVMEINKLENEDNLNLYEVTLKKFQETELISSCQGLSETFEVVPEQITDLNIELDENYYKVGEEADINITTVDENYKFLIDSIPINWLYDDEIIEINGGEGSYKLTTVAPGQTVIAAKAGLEITQGEDIYVRPADLDSVEAEISEEKIPRGQTTTLTITAKDANGEEYDLSNENITLAPLYEGVVEIKETEENNVFEITGLKDGITAIDAEVKGLSSRVEVEVYKPYVNSVTISVPSNKLSIGSIMEVGIDAVDQEGNEFDLSGSSVRIYVNGTPSNELGGINSPVRIVNSGSESIFIDTKESNTLDTFLLSAEVQGIESNAVSISLVPYSVEIKEISYTKEDNEIVDIVLNGENVLDASGENIKVPLGESLDVVLEAYDAEKDTLNLSRGNIDWRIFDSSILRREGSTEIDGNGNAAIGLETIGIGNSFFTGSVQGKNSSRVIIEVAPEIKCKLENFKISFGLDRIFMNINEEVRIAPYWDEDSVSASVFSSDDEEDVIKITKVGYGYRIKAVDTGTAEVYWYNDDGSEADGIVKTEKDGHDFELLSDKLHIMVGEPGEKISVGELVYDVEEKCMLPSINWTPETENKFEDCKKHWAKKDIILAEEAGIVGGYSENSFKPNKPVTRAEFCTMFVRTLGLDVTEKETTLTDLQNHWSKNNVETLKGMGIIGGYADGTFKPNKQITRAEVAAVIAKSLASFSSAENWFDDVKEGSWAGPYIDKVAGLGLVNGVGENSFAPNKSTTRAEAVTILVRMLKGLNW